MQVTIFACVGAGLIGMTAAISMPSIADPLVTSSCTDISTIPVQYTISYVAAIQGGIFHNFDGSGNGCDQCHTAGGQMPDLDSQDTPGPYQNIFNVESPDYAGEIFIVPNHPEQSLLFKKINCDQSGFGSRMPLNNAFGGLSAYQQAYIYDWIANGAPADATDTLFRNTFDVRGFFIDAVFKDGFQP